jgi:hypothetical protein
VDQDHPQPGLVRLPAALRAGRARLRRPMEAGRFRGGDVAGDLLDGAGSRLTARRRPLELPSAQCGSEHRTRPSRQEPLQWRGG